MSILNLAANRINTSVAGVTGLAEADVTPNLPTAPMVTRLTSPSQWGELGNLFSDLGFEAPQASTQPVSVQGSNGGFVPAPIATKPIVPTALGTWVGRARAFLGL
jgi:hypothetical protein